MKELNIREIVKAVEGTLVSGDGQEIVTGVSTDTRKIQNGDLFFALMGVTDGHQYIETAYDNGCGAAVVSQDVPIREGIPVIRVADTLKALQVLAKYYLSQFHIKKVAVTGSTGKTTTKEILYALLSAKYQTAKNMGNFNNHIGLPLTVFTVEPYHQAGIFEMGMSGLGEIDLMAEIVRPDTAVITNIGVSHIEKLGSRENILKAKLEAANYFTAAGKLVINDDNDLLQTVSEQGKSYEVIRVGTSPRCQYRMLSISDHGEAGVSFQLSVDGVVYDYTIHAAGSHNAYNAAEAVAAACEMGLDPALCQSALLNFQQADKRLVVTETEDGIKIIDDTYNASPDSMKAGLSVLKSWKGKRKIAILGDMFEMGDYAEKYHEEVGMFAASGGIDIIMTTGQDARFIHRGALTGLPEERCLHFQSKRVLIEYLGEILRPGDFVFVKASRGMHMEEIVEFVQKNRS